MSNPIHEDDKDTPFRVIVTKGRRVVGHCVLDMRALRALEYIFGTKKYKALCRMIEEYSTHPIVQSVGLKNAEREAFEVGQAQLSQNNPSFNRFGRFNIWQGDEPIEEE